MSSRFLRTMNMDNHPVRFRFVALAFILQYLSGINSVIAHESPIKYALNALHEQAESEPGNRIPFYLFHNSENLLMGIFQIKVGEEDTQPPHPVDEVHFFLEGKAKIQIGDKVFAVEAGDIVFAPKNVLHRIIEVERDVTLLGFAPKNQNPSD